MRDLFTLHKVGVGGDAETSLFVTGDGQTILACSHGGFTKPSPMWASTDGGATFKALDPQPNPIPSGDCDVAVGGDGSWYMLYDTIASATVAATRDQGRSWNIVYTAAVPFGGVDRPWIATTGPSTVYLTYANVMVAEPAIDMFAKSTDGGRTWTQQRLMSTTDGPERLNTVTGHMFLSDEGRTIRVPLDRWNEYTGSPHHFEIVTSRDAGETWTHTRVAGPHEAPLQLPAATIAGDGTLYAVYATGPTDAATVQFVFSGDDGRTWSAPIAIAEDVRFPGLSGIWVDGRPDGTATAAWMHVVDESGGTAWVVTLARLQPSEEDPLEFSGPLFEPVPGNQPVYEFLMVRHDAAGRAYVLYPLAGEGCKMSPPTAVAQNRNNQCVLLSVETSADLPRLADDS